MTIAFDFDGPIHKYRKEKIINHEKREKRN